MVDWTERYRNFDTPWDLGREHPELARRLEARELVPGEGFREALVAGCGHGHDALALARAGFRVTAVDIVADLRDHLEEKLAVLGGQFIVSDALSLDGHQFDLVFDHTFLCALDLSMRDDWGAMVRRVLKRGGILASLVYPVSKPIEDGGPPYRLTREAIEGAVGPEFETIVDESVKTPGHNSWAERWLVLRRA